LKKYQKIEKLITLGRIFEEYWKCICKELWEYKCGGPCYGCPWPSPFPWRTVFWTPPMSGGLVGGMGGALPDMMVSII